MSYSPLDRIGVSEVLQVEGSNSVSTSNAPIRQGIADAPDTIVSADSSISLMGCSELGHFSAGTSSWNEINSYRMFSQEIPRELYQDLTVNAAKLAETPAWLDLALIADSATPRIQIDELLTQFDRICDLAGVGPAEVLYQEDGMEITREAARRSLENNYLNLVGNNINSVPTYYRNIAADVGNALKGIIFSLRLPEDGSPESPDIIAKKKTAIEDLCRASEHSVLRRHAEAFMVYRVLSNQMETLDEIVKQFIQETKENLFINYYSLSTQSVHTLNFIRRAVGTEFGLNTSLSNLEDPYIVMGGINALSPENRHAPHTQPDQFRQVFARIYTPANILFNMKNFLNGRIASDPFFAHDISKFIANEIQAHEDAGRLTAADTADMPMPYQNDYDHPDAPYHLTDAGIKFLMVHFGHLNSATPNGHLVRAAAATT